MFQYGEEQMHVSVNVEIQGNFKRFSSGVWTVDVLWSGFPPVQTSDFLTELERKRVKKIEVLQHVSFQHWFFFFLYSKTNKTSKDTSSMDISEKLNKDDILKQMPLGEVFSPKKTPDKSMKSFFTYIL